jgi:hypothetical protein
VTSVDYAQLIYYDSRDLDYSAAGRIGWSFYINNPAHQFHPIQQFAMSEAPKRGQGRPRKHATVEDAHFAKLTYDCMRF